MSNFRIPRATSLQLVWIYLCNWSVMYFNIWELLQYHLGSLKNFNQYISIVEDWTMYFNGRRLNNIYYKCKIRLMISLPIELCFVKAFFLINWSFNSKNVFINWSFNSKNVYGHHRACNFSALFKGTVGLILKSL